MNETEIREAADAIRAISQATFESEEDILDQLTPAIISEEDSSQVLLEIDNAY
jgi:hypothetical protein